MQLEQDILILKKIPSKNRDVIITGVNRMGKKVVGYVYGGQGGGAKQKGSILEPGNLVLVDMVRPKKYIASSMYTLRTKELKWSSSPLRGNLSFFYSFCFLSELIEKVTLSYDLEDETSEEIYFSLITNFLFHVSQKIDSEAHDRDKLIDAYLNHTLVKLIAALGISPIYEECVYCGEELKDKKAVVFLEQENSFVHQSCCDKKANQSSESLWELFKYTSSYKFSDFPHFPQGNQSTAQALITYILREISWDRSQLKTLAFLQGLK